MAMRHGDRVSGLVLLGSVGTATSIGPYDRVLGLPVLGEGLAFTGWELSRRLLPVLRRRSTRLPQTLRALVRAVPHTRPEAAWRSFVVEQRALLAETPYLEAGLSSIRVPTAVVAGDRDRVVPARAASELAASVSGAELIWVPDAGHLLPQEQPAVLVDVIRRYSS
jgi:pimeloyl-ACP methyl ester carboxylesterase